MQTIRQQLDIELGRRAAPAEGLFDQPFAVLVFPHANGVDACACARLGPYRYNPRDPEYSPTVPWLYVWTRNAPDEETAEKRLLAELWAMPEQRVA